jgi:small conductance mechanosensitive channel
MPDFEFNIGSHTFNLSGVVDTALQVLLIVAVALVALAILRRVIPRAVERRVSRIRDESPEELAKRTDTVSNALKWVATAIVLTVAFIMILSKLGVDTTPLIAAIGLMGLGIGLAAQKILRDYLNGFFILLEDWYRVGEVATVAGITGVIVEINLRRTTLRDLDGTMHVVPNSNIELASNMTRQWARIHFNVTVAYKENLNQVWQLVDKICQEFKEDPTWGEHMLTTPAVVRVDSLGDHGIDIKILGDTKPGQQWALMGELRKRIKEQFDEEGIEIPWPHTKVFFGNEPKAESSA